MAAIAYADYEYYAGYFYGELIDEEDFPRLSLRATQYIDYITRGAARRHDDLEAVKMACCALAEQFQVMESAQRLAAQSFSSSVSDSGTSGNGELQSQTVGNWSVSFRSSGDSASAALSAFEEAKRGLASIAGQYLAGTGLLYRGIRCRK